MSKSKDWKFGERISCERCNRLMQISEFGEIITAISRDMRVTGYIAELGNKPALRGCRRAIFEVDVLPETFDVFFNSPAGYRAQYYLSPELGTIQNARLIQSLMEKLLVYAAARPTSEMTFDDVKKSLLMRQSKIWIREEDDCALLGDDLIVDVVLDRWVREARVAWAQASNNEQRNYAVRGVLAPVGTTLEVKGGWITEIGEERQDPDKKHRAGQIYQYGYS